MREGDPTARTNPQAVDFSSPDMFNFTVLDVSRNGKTVTVKSVGSGLRGGRYRTRTYDLVRVKHAL